MRIGWDSPLSSLAGKKANDVVKETGFETVGELLDHYPRRYLDLDEVSTVEELVEGELVTLVVT